VTPEHARAFGSAKVGSPRRLASQATAA
jgi:hypothetical protein